MPLNPLCQKGDTKGNCVSCYKDYVLNGNTCVPTSKNANDPST